MLKYVAAKLITIHLNLQVFIFFMDFFTTQSFMFSDRFYFNYFSGKCIHLQAKNHRDDVVWQIYLCASSSVFPLAQLTQTPQSRKLTNQQSSIQSGANTLLQRREILSFQLCKLKLMEARWCAPRTAATTCLSKNSVFHLQTQCTMHHPTSPQASLFQTVI